MLFVKLVGLYSGVFKASPSYLHFYLIYFVIYLHHLLAFICYLLITLFACMLFYLGNLLITCLNNKSL